MGTTAGSSYGGAPAHTGGTYRTARPRGGAGGTGKSWKKVMEYSFVGGFLNTQTSEASPDSASSRQPRQIPGVHLRRAGCR
ncbi:hypothetical protein J2X01_004272 [Arthrobacter ginsengisoli]|uniref:Uncharacterized protein n=1 Tax=Arthrobacter ginsengisoli TaxID=1356565 RepID=A0ABU1UIE4_9MICC|nr:hypothetical protein [Arthrobacter ginsengisoli]